MSRKGPWPSESKSEFSSNVQSGLGEGAASPVLSRSCSKPFLIVFSFDGDGDGFRIDRASSRYRFAILLALQDVKANTFQHAGLGLFDGFTETIDAGQIFTVGVVLPIFFFDGDRIGVVSH